MIEMSVRAVKRAGEDRLVAVLERGADAAPAQGRLLITLSRPEAHVIFHELRAEKTLPGQTFELMANVVTQLQGKLTAVELVADDAGKPAARLRLEGAEGRSTIPTRAIESPIPSATPWKAPRWARWQEPGPDSSPVSRVEPAWWTACGTAWRASPPPSKKQFSVRSKLRGPTRP
ncbi:hypothetical protein DYH09_28105 [bacterium CPR1]|nr:hypothetical protein [bacterium CPR1]